MYDNLGDTPWIMYAGYFEQGLRRKGMRSHRAIGEEGQEVAIRPATW